MFHWVMIIVLSTLSLSTIRANEPVQTIDSPIGTGEKENNGDAGDADRINIGQPFGVEVGPNGSMFITEVENHRVLEYSPSTGKVSTVAGTGVKGLAGDGGLATEADLNEPYEVRFAENGDMYFVEMKNHLVRKVDAKTKTIQQLLVPACRGIAETKDRQLKRC